MKYVQIGYYTLVFILSCFMGLLLGLLFKGTEPLNWTIVFVCGFVGIGLAVFNNKNN